MNIKVVTETGSTYYLLEENGKFFLARESEHRMKNGNTGDYTDGSETFRLELEGKPEIGIIKSMYCYLKPGSPYGDLIRTSRVKEIINS